MTARTGVRALLALAVLGVAGWFMIRPFTADPAGTLRSLRALGPGVVGAGLVILFAGVGMTTMAWREPLQEIGAPLPPGEAVKMFAAGQLGKYVPGAMWSLLWQARIAAEHGISATQVGLAFGVYALVSLVTGGAVGLLAVGALVHGGLLVALIVVVVLAVAAAPVTLALGLRLLLRVRWLSARAAPVRTGVLVRSVVWSTGSWVISGCHLWVICCALGAPRNLAVAAASLGGFALATAVGSVAIVVPDGLGIRETLLISVLSTCLPLSSAVVAAAASRLLLTAADLCAFGYGTWAARRARPALQTHLGGVL